MCFFPFIYCAAADFIFISDFLQLLLIAVVLFAAAFDHHPITILSRICYRFRNLLEYFVLQWNQGY